MPDDKVTSLREFVEHVRRIRQLWTAPADKELWFRGEGKKYEKSLLRPKLYRPPEKRRMKPIPELLEIEYELYEEFTRCGVQLCDTNQKRATRSGISTFLCSTMVLPRACSTGRMER